MNATTLSRTVRNVNNTMKAISPLPYGNDQAGGALITNPGRFFKNHSFLYKSNHTHTADGWPVAPGVINPFFLSNEEKVEEVEDGIAGKKVKTTTPTEPPPPPRP